MNISECSWFFISKKQKINSFLTLNTIHRSYRLIFYQLFFYYGQNVYKTVLYRRTRVIRTHVFKLNKNEIVHVVYI